jgi:hypothetical protein
MDSLTRRCRVFGGQAEILCSIRALPAATDLGLAATDFAVLHGDVRIA